MKYIKLFEAYSTGTLSPEDIGTANDVVVTITGDGIYTALLSKDEGHRLFDLVQDSGNGEAQIISGKNAAYAYTNDLGVIEVEGPEFEEKTPDIGYWINSESNSKMNKYKENPNFDSAQEEESLVMTLRKGYVTYSEADGHSVEVGQEPLEQFIRRFF